MLNSVLFKKIGKLEAKMKFFFASLFVAAFAVTSSQCRKTKAEWNLFKVHFAACRKRSPL